VVTGAVVKLIGFNLAPVATTKYMPTDPWTAIITMAAVILMAAGRPGVHADDPGDRPVALTSTSLAP
jgi:xanthine/uracil permease